MTQSTVTVGQAGGEVASRRPSQRWLETWSPQTSFSREETLLATQWLFTALLLWGIMCPLCPGQGSVYYRLSLQVVLCVSLQD